MRKIMAMILAALMLVSCVAAQAEAADSTVTPEAAVVDAAAEAADAPAGEPEAEPTATAEPLIDVDAISAEAVAQMDALTLPEITRVNDYHELKVGMTTPLSGSFFTEMWGNNTSDIDVRFLLHGYNLMEWEDGTGAYGMDTSVVSALVGTADAEGNRTYNIALYDDLYYSDGMPVTARDYAFSILLSMSPEVAAIGGQTTGSDCLVGAAEYKSGESATLAGVRIINDTQFTITVSADYLPFFYELALLNYNPYPIHIIAPGCTVADDGEGVYIRNMTQEELDAQTAAYAEADARVEAALTAENETREATGEEPFPSTLEEILVERPEVTLPEPPAEGEEAEPLFTAELLQETILNPETGYLSHPSVVSGPYRELSFDLETREASFERNLMFKGDSDGLTPRIERVIVKPVTTDNELEALASGEVDLLNKTVNADVLTTGMALVAQTDALAVTNYTRSGYSFISFSCEREPVNNQAVRQAIAYCLDRDALVADYVGNYGLAVDGYYGLGQWMYQMVLGQIALQEPEEGEGEAGEAGEAAEGEASAAAETGEAAEEEEPLTMENIRTYGLDVPAAVALLEGEGWTLNREGEPFDAEKDDVRCKQVGEGEDAVIVPLELKMIYPEGNDIGEALEANFVAHLAEAGVQLTVEPKPMTELLDIYYRNVERDVDLIYLATNFATVFEPSGTFNPADAYQGRANRTGIADEELYERAVDMRKTEPGEVLEYCRKWVAFQERFAEVLPTIPIYSNVYFDFETSILQNYLAGSNLTWSQALTAAYLSDAPDEPEPTEEEEELDLEPGEIIIE